MRTTSGDHPPARDGVRRGSPEDVGTNVAVFPLSVPACAPGGAMTSRLPWWIEGGGFVLAFNAGIANAIGLLGFQHQAMSHLTGTTTMVGVALAEGHFGLTLHLLAVLGSFTFGAVVSAMIVNGGTLKISRRYYAVLFLEGAAFFAAAVLLQDGSTIGHHLASFACGAQNAMATTYSGSIVRTTHVTGVFTDIGIWLGQALRGHRQDLRQIKIHLALVSGFVVGGGAGAVLYAALGLGSLYACAGVAMALGFTAMVMVRREPGR